MLGGAGGSGRIMVRWLVGQWIVGVLDFQKIFGLCVLKGHIVEIRWDVMLVHKYMDEQQNMKIRARIPEIEFAKTRKGTDGPLQWWSENSD